MNQIVKTDYHQRLQDATNGPMTSDQLSKRQRDAVGYFFRRLKLVSPAEYDRMVPTESTRTELQRDYAPYLKDFSKAHIDAGFDRLHTLRQQGDPEHRFLDIDKAIGLVQVAARTGVYSPRSGKFFIPKPDPEAQPNYLPDRSKEERCEAARERALAKVNALFNDL